MTVDEAVADICGRLNLTSQEAKTRVAGAFNRYYRTVASSIGIDAARFTSVTATTTNGVATVEFTGLEKIDRVLDATDSTAIRLLTEVTVHQVRSMQPGTGEPVCFAIQNTDYNAVTIRMDTLPQTTYSLVADGWSTLGELTGNDSPAIPASFHDILIQYVLAEEYERKEKTDLADRCMAKAEHRLSELRFHLADTGIDWRQGSSTVSTQGGTSSGSGSGNAGATSYTQSGLLTFDRGSNAPFACVSGAAVVTYLDADKLDGQHGTYYLDRVNHTGTLTVASTGLTMSATDKLVGRDTASGGASEEIGVTGGIEFTGSGSIRTGAFTGDVTKAAGGTATTIAADAVTTTKILADNVTYAKIQNVSAASKLLGRGSASGSGDVEEITVGSGLTMTATTLALTDGAWTSPAFSAGDYTGSGSMTWTVASGDVGTYAYRQLGKTMTVAFVINTSTVGGTPNTALQIAIPNSKTATKTIYNPVLLIDSGTRATGYANVQASGTIINITRTDAANFTAATDTTYVFGQLTFEVN